MYESLDNDTLIALCDCLTQIEGKSILFGNLERGGYAFYLQDESGVSLLEPKDKDYTAITHALLMNNYVQYVPDVPLVNYDNKVFTLHELSAKGKERKITDFEKLKALPKVDSHKQYILFTSDNRNDFCISRVLLANERYAIINKDGAEMSSAHVRGDFRTLHVGEHNIVAYFSEEKLPEMIKTMNAMQEEISDITQNYDDEIKMLKEKIITLTKSKNRDKELVVCTVKEISKEKNEEISPKM